MWQLRHQWLSEKKFNKIAAGLFWIVLVTVDQVSKYQASTLQTATINQGIAFGLFNQVPLGLLAPFLVAVLILGGWAWYRYFPNSLWAGVWFFAGAVSNVIDRLMVGGVRDWLPTPILATRNNLADWYITIGVMMICWQLANQKRYQVRTR